MNINQRPVCHRAEDLVTYLYGEASAEEARDFAAHLQQCDACRAEFALFNQVHNSIVAWRNETIGVVAAPQVAPANVVASQPFVHHERKLSALAALREFFSVSPLWLRGATAFAGLFLFGLIVFAVARVSQQPLTVANNSDKKYTEQEFQQAVQKEVAAQVARLSEEKREPVVPPNNDVQPPVRFATHRSRPKTQPNKLTREEREQLAADLGLIPGREEESPFVLPDEPDQ